MVRRIVIAHSTGSGPFGDVNRGNPDPTILLEFAAIVFRRGDFAENVDPLLEPALVASRRFRNIEKCLSVNDDDLACAAGVH